MHGISLGADYCYPGELRHATGGRLHWHLQHYLVVDVYLRDGAGFGRPFEPHDFVYGCVDGALSCAKRYVCLTVVMIY